MGTSGEQLRRTRPSLASLGRMVKRPRRDSGGTMPATVDSWRMRMAEPWTIKGEYLENRNCEVLCPCLLGPRNARGGAMARPTEGTCDVPVVFAVERERFGTVALDGTHAALVVHTPGPMGEGNWTAGVYVDERATADQRRALESIFAGRAGGVMANIAGARHDVASDAYRRHPLRQAGTEALRADPRRARRRDRGDRGPRRLGGLDRQGEALRVEPPRRRPGHAFDVHGPRLRLKQRRPHRPLLRVRLEGRAD